MVRDGQGWLGMIVMLRDAMGCYGMVRDDYVCSGMLRDG